MAEPVILDVRTPEEFAAGHVLGALNVDLNGGAFERAIAGLARDVPYVLYCRSGHRSAIAAGMMLQAGFADVQNLGTAQEAADALGTVLSTD